MTEGGSPRATGSWGGQPLDSFFWGPIRSQAEPSSDRVPAAGALCSAGCVFGSLLCEAGAVACGLVGRRITEDVRVGIEEEFVSF